MQLILFFFLKTLLLPGGSNIQHSHLLFILFTFNHDKPALFALQQKLKMDRIWHDNDHTPLASCFKGWIISMPEAHFLYFFSFSVS